MTQPGAPFTERVTAPPADPYGLSKYEAEQSLLELAEQCQMEVVMVRPPLVYGPGVKANFASMVKWVRAGVPLPLAGLDNRRSLVGLDNLCDFIRCLLTHPAAANQVFLVSDGQDVSTSELLRQIGEAAGCPARLFAVPGWLLRWGMCCPALGAQMQRLFVVRCNWIPARPGICCNGLRLFHWRLVLSGRSAHHQRIGCDRLVVGCFYFLGAGYRRTALVYLAA